MTTPANFTEKYIFDWVKKKLGDPTVNVELDETQIKHCIDDVIELFQKYRPKEYYQGTILSEGYHLVDAPDGSMGVLGVEFNRYESELGSGLEDVFNPFYFISYGGMGGVDIQTYHLMKHWIEVMQRTFGTEEGYELLDDGRVFISVPGEYKVSIMWAMPWTGLEDLHRPYQHLFLNLVLAKSRQVLGQIRGKYGQGVPGAGGQVQLDGEYQRQKGQEDETKYTDELMRISPHFIPSLG